MSKTFAIYLPAYNAALTLPSVLDRIPAELKRQAARILIVDNFSSDDTQAVALRYKTEHQYENMEVIRNPRNMGYGGSQKVAYRYCIDQGIDVVAMVHADGQYAPEILGEMMAPILEGKADMVFGSRIAGHPLKGGMPLHRFIGNRILTTIQNLVLGSRLSEFHSGYRIFSSKCLKQLAFETLSSDYHFDTEMIILHLRAGLRIVERPIPTFYGDEKNYVNIWAYGSHVLVTTISYLLHCKGIRTSRNWARILAAPVAPTAVEPLQGEASQPIRLGHPGDDMVGPIR